MNKLVAEQFKIICGRNISPDDWLWCHRCHRCYKASEFRVSKDRDEIFLLCHYKDCHGDLPLDSRLWRQLITCSKELPKIPLKGKTYEFQKVLDKGGLDVAQSLKNEHSLSCNALNINEKPV